MNVLRFAVPPRRVARRSGVVTRLTLSAASLCAAALCSIALPAQAQVPTLAFEVQQHELDNGLRVVLSPDPSTPTVGIAVYYDVGSRNEVVGRSGFAHLFEHMMFQGSENVPKGGHFQEINRNGGRMNGTTSEDRTNYFEALPSDRLELGLWLEADRMRSLEISAENFENQRQVVKEERRLRVDNSPYVPGILAFYAEAYTSWEYAHSVIGSMADLDAAELEDVQAFFDLWYAPNNATLVVVGDFEPATALTMIDAHFGDIPRGNEPPPVSFEEPVRTAYAESRIEDQHATQAALLLGWNVPGGDHPDQFALELLSAVLSGGESSRLYGRLVREDQLAVEVDADLEWRRGPDLFTVWAITQDATPEQVRDAVMEELERVIADGVTDAELLAAKEQLYSAVVSQVETVLGRARTMGRDAVFYDEPDRINGILSRYQAVTSEDLLEVAERWLQPTAAVGMLIEPSTTEGGE